MPLHAMKYPAPADVDDPKDTTNRVTFMHMSIDAHRPGFGLPPPGWDGSIGSVLITDATRRPLTIETASAFNDFCEFHVKTYLDWANSKFRGARIVRMTKDRRKALEEITLAK